MKSRATATKLQVIKVVREAKADLGLRGGQATIRRAREALLENVSKEDAEKWKKKLEEAGAVVEIQ